MSRSVLSRIWMFVWFMAMALVPGLRALAESATSPIREIKVPANTSWLDILAISADGAVVTGDFWPVGQNRVPFRWDACAGLELLPVPGTVGRQFYTPDVSGDGSNIITYDHNFDTGLKTTYVWVRQGWK